MSSSARRRSRLGVSDIRVDSSKRLPVRLQSRSQRQPQFSSSASPSVTPPLSPSTMRVRDRNRGASKTPPRSPRARPLRRNGAASPQSAVVGELAQSPSEFDMDKLLYFVGGSPRSDKLDLEKDNHYSDVDRASQYDDTFTRRALFGDNGQASVEMGDSLAEPFFSFCHIKHGRSRRAC